MENVIVDGTDILPSGTLTSLPEASQVISSIGNPVSFVALNIIRVISFTTSTLYKLGAVHGVVAYVLARAFDIAKGQKSNETRTQVFVTTGLAIGLFCAISKMLLIEKSFFHSIVNPMLKCAICTALISNTLITQFKDPFGDTIIEKFPILKHYYTGSKKSYSQEKQTVFSKTAFPITIEEDSKKVGGLLTIGIVFQVIICHLFSEQGS